MESINDGIYYEETGTYFHNGTLASKESKLIELIKPNDDEIVLFEKNLIYSPKLFELHLSYVQEVTILDDITSCVSRCVEYGIKDSLILLLKNIDRLIGMSTDEFVKICDKQLLLRKIDLPCYNIAKEYGFIDMELEARIIMIQKLICKKDIDVHIYSGPKPENYCKVNDIIDYSGETQRNRYFGYRHTLYYMKYNRINRYQLVKLFKSDWHGDCRFQAYVDSFPDDTELLTALTFSKFPKNSEI